MLAVTLVSVVLVALMAPLVITHADGRTQALFVSRLDHVTRFAVLAENALEAGDASSLESDLRRYAEVYGGSVLVINANRETVAQAGTLDADDEPEMVEGALAGRSSPPPDTAWPWRPEEIVIASPVGRDAQVLGAVVMVAPSDSVQSSVSTWVLWLLLGGLATLLLTVFGVVSPFVGWVMRPVHDLDEAARRLAAGDLASRAHGTGPPELRELATSFNTMADNVETSQRQQRDLVADAAHQLGNPLTSLRLRIENLGSSGADPDEVGVVLEEADRLDDIVESLLDLSQVGAGAAAVVVVDVAEEVRHRCEMWAPALPDLRIDVPEKVLARATAGLIDLVLDALLDNAAKFAEGATVDVSVVAGDPVRLRVRDHGPGLDAEDIGKVGARFFRGRAHQNVAGTGLGLAIVRARVEDVGGRVTVTAADGGGLQVDVELPAVTAGSPGSSAAHPDGARPER